MTSSASATSRRRRKPYQEPPLLVSVAEAARLLSIGRTSIWEMCSRGDILKVKVGRRVLIPRTEIDRIARGG